ncbi:epimerase [Sediminimonas sp.]|uniref:epimerase n=1 Tax=Sediminimonas sp. TaxID=2823379 RepID=UPI0025FF2F6E|nr:epimerase [Sediminimonas sp.]
MNGTVLILGRSGRFGRAAAAAFEEAGWQVRGFARGQDDLNSAARGADVIVMGWNPPYPQWAAQLPGLHARVRRVALANDATVILPGNVYVFGPDQGMPWDETTPHRATNPLGRLRIGMEAAYRAEGVRTIVLRAGDFLDTDASGNWFDRVLVRELPRGVLRYPGNPGIPHAWAWLPDMARAAVALAEQRDGLQRFEDVPFPGLTLTGNEMATELARLRGHAVRVKPLAWWQLWLARPFMPMAGPLLEMRYLWDTPHRLSGAKFKALLPDFRLTATRDALRGATAHLPAPGAAARKGRDASA